MDLWSASDFVTRDCCVTPGSSWGVWAAIAQAADFTIAISYFLIPYALVRKSKAVTDQLTQAEYIIFALFIFFCGVGHLTDIIVWYWPAYRLFTAIDCLTAALSLSTAVMIPILVYRVTENG